MLTSSLSDAEADALLRGSDDLDPDLEAVARLLRAAKAHAATHPQADFSEIFDAAARESRVTPIERFANEHSTPHRDRRPQLVQRVAMAGVALLVFVAMSGGMAYAADGAKPGDLMYGLDQALEAVGFNNGGAAERLEEVEALIASGAIADGLRHASVLLEGNQAGDAARAALSAAAARFEDAADSPGSQAAQVGGLIQYLQGAVASGDGVSGQMVAGMARGLGGSHADPAGPPVGSGSQADPAGPPADHGSQADPAGPPVDHGSQADPAGPPVDPGSVSSDRGRSEPGHKGK